MKFYYLFILIVLLKPLFAEETSIANSKLPIYLHHEVAKASVSLGEWKLKQKKSTLEQIFPIYVAVENGLNNELLSNLRNETVTALLTKFKTTDVQSFDLTNKSSIILKKDEVSLPVAFEAFPTLSQGSILIVKLVNDGIFWQLIQGRSHELMFSYLTYNAVTYQALSRDYETLQGIYEKKTHNEPFLFTSFSFSFVNTYLLSANYLEQWGSENQYFSGAGFTFYRDGENLNTMLNDDIKNMFRHDRPMGMAIHFNIGGLLPFYPDISGSLSPGFQFFLNSKKQFADNKNYTDALKLFVQGSTSIRVYKRLSIYFHLIYPTYWGMGLSWM